MAQLNEQQKYLLGRVRKSRAMKRSNVVTNETPETDTETYFPVGYTSRPT